MNDVQESLYQFAKVVSGGMSESGTQVLEGTVESVDDSGLGLYTVSCLGAKFQAYSNKSIYHVKDRVYVMKTAENSTNPRLILAMSSPVGSSSRTSEESSKDTQYLVIPGNILGDTNITADIDTYYDYSGKQQSIKIENYTDRANAQTRFADAIKKYNIFALRFDVKTSILEAQQHYGNYGIKLSIKFDGDNSPKVYTLDKSAYTGTIYKFEDYTTQTLYFKIGKDEVYRDGTIDLSAFKVEFMGLDTDKESPDPDIKIKNIGLYAVLELSSEQVSNGILNIESDTGSLFLTGEESKTLKAVLYYGGQKVSDLSKYQCYWYIEDPTVNDSADGYETHGGAGWRILNSWTEVDVDASSKTTTGSRRQYDTKSLIYKVYFSDVYSTNTYKCILIDEKGQQYKSTYDVSLKEKKYQFTLAVEDYVTNTIPVGLKRIILNCTTKVSSAVPDYDKKSLEYVWERYDKGGTKVTSGVTMLESHSYDKQSDSYFAKFGFLSDALVDFNTFKCFVYEKKAVGTKEEIVPDESDPTKTKPETITLYKSILLGYETLVVKKVNGAYMLSIEGGNKLFKYDADGDSPMVGNYDGPEANRITSLDPLTIKIIRTETGKEISEEEYKACTVTWKVPIDSMLVLNSVDKKVEENGYYIIKQQPQKGSGLIYNISTQYKPSKRNNTIHVDVLYRESYNSEVNLSSSTDLIFTKDGETGTNGGKYTAQITYNGAPHEAMDKDNYPYKLRLFYIVDDATNQHWYYCYDNQTLLPFSKESGVSGLGINLYRSGTLVTDDILQYKPQWRLMDWDEKDAGSEVPFKGPNPVCSIAGNVIYPRTVNNFYNQEKDIFYDTCTVIQCTLTVGPGSTKVDEKDATTTSNEIITASYPIEVVGIKNVQITKDDVDENGVIANKTDNTGKVIAWNKVLIPLMTGGFNYAMYSASGTNPQYDTDSPFTVKAPMINDSNLDNYNFKWSVSPLLLIKNDDDKIECDIQPVQNYDNAETMNYIKAEVSNKQGEAYKAALEATKEEKQLQLDAWKAIQDAFNTYKNSLIPLLNTYNSLYSDWQNLGASNWISYVDKCHLYNYERANRLKLLNDTYKDRIEEVKTNVPYEYAESALSALKYVSDETSLSNWPNKTFDINKITNVTPKKGVTLTDSEEAAIKVHIDIYNDFIEKYNDAIMDVKTIDVSKALNYAKTIQNISSFCNQIKFALNKYPDINYEFSTDTKINAKAKELLKEYTFEDELNAFGFKDKATRVEEYFKKAYDTAGSKMHTFANINECFTSVYNELTNESTGFLQAEGTSYILQERIKNLFEKADKLFTSIQKMLQNNEIVRLECEEACYDSQIVYYKPILLYCNAYSFSYLSGYTGQKMYTGENNEFLFAPQVGATIIEDGKMTGMVMGKRYANKDQSDPTLDIGLFGYNKGIETFFLDAHSGKASFGRAGKGQIIIDPEAGDGNEGVITGGKFSTTDKTGMQINLTHPKIEWGNSNFSVDENGILKAVNADISGKISVGAGGTIAGWTIEEHQLYKTKDKEFSLHIGDGTLGVQDVFVVKKYNNSTQEWEYPFYVRADGTFHSEFGSIAGWNIDKDGLKKGKLNWDDAVNAGVFFGTKGLYFGNGGGDFLNEKAVCIYGEGHPKCGTLYARGAEIHGDIYADNGCFKGRVEADSGYFKGELNGNTITGATINNGKGTFSVNANGDLTAKSVDITGGKIAGLTINNGYDYLSMGSGSNFVGIGAYNGSDTSVAFYAGGESQESAPLKIHYDGNIEIRTNQLDNVHNTVYMTIGKFKACPAPGYPEEIMYGIRIPVWWEDPETEEIESGYYSITSHGILNQKGMPLYKYRWQ